MGLWWGEWLGLEECRGKFVGGDGWILGERTGRLRLLCEVLQVFTIMLDVYGYVFMVGGTGRLRLLCEVLQGCTIM